MSLTVFTCCNGRYKSFRPLFISSLLSHEGPDVFVEIGVDALGDEIKEQTEVLDGLYKDRLLIRQVDFPSGVMPNAIRFLTEPLNRSDYVYIVDVDMIFLAGGICSLHLEHMSKTGLPFSNKVRDAGKRFMDKYDRVAGRHFSPWSSLYPLPKLSSIPPELLQQDEAMLYWILTEKGCRLSVGDDFKLNLHGVHFTPNRTALDYPNRWGYAPWMDKLRAYFGSDSFKIIEPLCSGVCGEQLKVLRGLL